MSIEVGKEQLISAAAAARLLAVSRNTLKSWLKSGKLEGLKVGCAWKTSVPAIERFLQRCQVTPVVPPTPTKPKAAPKPKAARPAKAVPIEADVYQLAEEREREEAQAFLKRVGLG